MVNNDLQKIFYSRLKDSLHAPVQRRLHLLSAARWIEHAADQMATSDPPNKWFDARKPISKDVFEHAIDEFRNTISIVKEQIALPARDEMMAAGIAGQELDDCVKRWVLQLYDTIFSHHKQQTFERSSSPKTLAISGLHEFIKLHWVLKLQKETEKDLSDGSVLPSSYEKFYSNSQDSIVYFSFKCFHDF